MADGGDVGRVGDYVEYFLFPSLSGVKEKEGIRAKLDELCDVYVAHLSQYLVQFIWQNEPFKLTVVEKATASLPPHLHGRTHYGDNIEDEWFIVFLLLQLTKAFKDLVVRVVDNDGEFLLIEAAEVLQKWMTPESCENRVYLYQNEIHILPQARIPGRITNLPSGMPSVADAVAAVRQCSEISKADAVIQKDIRKRIAKYPDKIRDGQHRDHCFVPAAVAAILRHRPDLVTAAVVSFYLRDPVDMKVCRAMKYFPPETRVMTDVLFTKCSFAQLMQQKYIPDKRTGWNIPAPTSPEFKAYDLGMKLACGFEILAANAEPAVMHPSSSLNWDPDTDDRWNRFLGILKKIGFFRGSLEHSKIYNELLSQAKLYYSTNMQDANKMSLKPSDEVLKLLNSVEVDLDQMKKNARVLPPPDDDGWLNVTPEKLDRLLSTYGNGSSTTAATDAEDTTSKDIASSLEAFVSHVSSHEGAEFPKMRTTKMGNDPSHRVTFDPDAFADAMQSILDFRIPDWEDDRSSSGMSDYSDENDDIDLSKPSRSESEENGKGFVSEMRTYMDRMDRELASTVVGQSYETASTTEGRVTLSGRSEENVAAANGNGLEDYKPIDVDLTALKNILESYNSQQGLPGPASNLLETMGVTLPPPNVDPCDY